MYDQSFVPNEQNGGGLQRKYLLVKRKRRDLEQQVEQTKGNSNLLQSKIQQENVRQSIFSQLYNRFYTAAEVRTKIKRDHSLLASSRKSTLEQLRQKNSQAKSLRDCWAKQIRHSLVTAKSFEAKMTKSTMSDLLTRTIEERESNSRKRLFRRQKQPLGGPYYIENITSQDVQVLYLSAIDKHRELYHDRLRRRENLLRIKEDLEASGLYRHTISQ